METLTCNACGAPLQVPQSANYVTCKHCGQQLAVRRSDSVTFTEAVDKLSQVAESLSERVDQLSRHSELDELDRRWEQKRQEYLVSDKHGNRHLPTESGSMIGGIIIGGFGCLWTVMAIAITSSAPSIGPFVIAKFAFPLFGVLFVIGGVMTSINQYNKAQEYRQAEQRHNAERAKLLREQS